MSARVRITTQPVSAAEVLQLANEWQLKRIDDTPWTSGTREFIWEGSERSLSFVTHAVSGAALLILRGDNLDEWEAIVQEAIPSETWEGVVAHTSLVKDSKNKVRHLNRLDTLLLVNLLEHEPILRALGSFLMDEEPLVRWAAAVTLETRFDALTVELLAEAAETYADLKPTLQLVQDHLQRSEEGTLFDAPTKDTWVLLQRAREGRQEGQFRRVEQASEALLDEWPSNTEGLFLRAVAYKHLGDEWLALGLMSAAKAETTINLGVYQDEENGLSDDIQQIEELEQLLEDVEQELSDLQSQLHLHEPLEETDAFVEQVTRWLERLQDQQYERSHFAQALLPYTHSLKSLLSYVAGASLYDPVLLRHAIDRIPDAPEARYSLALSIEDDAPQDAEVVFLDTLKALEVPVEERSKEAQQIHRLTSDPLTVEQVLKRLARQAYDARDWATAERWSEELVRLDPDSMNGWQMWANSLTFGLKHQEAVVAYQQAIEEMTRVIDIEDHFILESDPRPGMFFNLACVLGKLGQASEALEALRQAVLGDEKYGEQARSDDYLEDLWEDPTFLAITSAEPSALILDKEKDPDYLQELIQRSGGLSHLGRTEQALEVGERALFLTQTLEQPVLEAQARSAMGRTLALVGELEDAVAHLNQAVELSAEAPADIRAEIMHTLGVVLHEAKQWDKAEAAYRSGQTLRVNAYGPDHPSLAKSYGDLSRLASHRGDSPHNVSEPIAQGIALLERYIAQSDVTHDETWLEAWMDLCILSSNLVFTRMEEQRLEEAIAALSVTAERIRKAVPLGVALSPSFLDNAVAVARGLESMVPDDRRQTVVALIQLLETSQISGPREEVQERLFWRRLRSLARRVRSKGVHDADFAGMLMEAMRGELSPEVQRYIPELQGFQNQIAERLRVYANLLSMMAMGLGTVEAGGSNIDEALENLEELCVSSLYIDGPLASA